MKLNELLDQGQGTPTTLMSFVHYLRDVLVKAGVKDAYWKGPGLRIWTRGDGSRYRDPVQLLMSGKYGDRAWNVLRSLPELSKELTVRAESKVQWDSQWNSIV